MSNRDSCRHHFEHVKQARPFTEREYMQCTKCCHQNPLGLFQHWDTERDGPAVKWPPQDNGGKLPTGLDYFHNLLSPPGPFMRLLKRKRKPIVKVRRNDVSIDGTLTVKSWKWECRICKQTWWSLRWWTTQNSATRHAHNHHGGQVK